MKIKLTGKKNKNIQQLIFSTLDILHEVGIPLDNLSDRRLEKMAMALLAVANIKNSFIEAMSSKDFHFLKTRDIIDFENKYFGENISSGSYDDIRRKDLILLVASDIVINSASIEAKATNNPTRGYGLNPLFSELIKKYNTIEWENSLKDFNTKIRSLREELARNRELQTLPVTLPSGLQLGFSAGEHNVLQKEIIEVFLSKFGFDPQILYVGDTTDKFLYKDEKKLKEIKCFDLEHDELPDIIAYSSSKNLLFLIEAVHSAGTMSEIRVKKLKNQLRECTLDIVFVTAFLTKKDFKKWILEIAWETEVWIAENPEHMIHFNGYKFLELH